MFAQCPLWSLPNKSPFRGSTYLIAVKALEYKVGPYGLLVCFKGRIEPLPEESNPYFQKYMDCYLVDILYLSEAFGGTRIGNCDIKPTDGATIFAYLRTGETSGID